MLPKKQLGRTEMWVTQLGYGSMGLRGPDTWGIRVVSESDAERMLHAVLDAGINFIDTSPDYGLAEDRIGRFLSGRRDEFYLATKCGCDPVQHQDHLEIRHTWSRDVIQRNLETSLSRLQTDHLDLLQFHGGDVQTLEEVGLLDLLADFREQGTVRYIGMSNKHPHIQPLIDLDFFDTFQVPFSCLAPEHDLVLRNATASGAGVIIRGGIAQGGPDAEIQRPALNDVWNAALLDELLTEDISRSELILRHTLGHSSCHTVIVGTCNLEHLQQNRQACLAGPLSDALRNEIDTRVLAVLQES